MKASKDKIAVKAKGRKPLIKQPVGRPPKYTSAEEMQIKIDEYFAQCDASDPPRPYTIAGLAYHLDISTQQLREYQAKDTFPCIIKAKQKVELAFEERLCAGNATGSIFWLKNHAGYKDKTEQDINHTGEVKLDLTVNFVEPSKE